MPSIGKGKRKEFEEETISVLPKRLGKEMKRKRNERLEGEEDSSNDEGEVNQPFNGAPTNRHLFK